MATESNWTAAKRIIVNHLKSLPEVRHVAEGEDTTVNKRATVLLGAPDGEGETLYSILGETDYGRTLYIKVVADSPAQLENVMRSVRTCWRKSTAIGQTRMTELNAVNCYNIYPQGMGDTSLPVAGQSNTTYEGVIPFQVWFREVAA